MMKQAQIQPPRKFTPSKKNHAPYIKLIQKALGPSPLPRGKAWGFADQIADWIIYTSFLTLPTEEWEDKFNRAHKAAIRVEDNRVLFSRTIALGVLTPEVEKAVLEILPHIDQDLYFGHAAPGKPSPETAPGYGGPVVPLIPRKRKPSIPEFIEAKAPSINYVRVWRFLFSHSWNKISSKGRHIFPYGQEYITRETEVSLREVSRIFNWLKRRHFIFKRSNENPKEHKTAKWFVCTSWKQTLYFSDPKHLHSKKRPKQPKKTARKSTPKR